MEAKVCSVLAHPAAAVLQFWLVAIQAESKRRLVLVIPAMTMKLVCGQVAACAPSKGVGQLGGVG